MLYVNYIHTCLYHVNVHVLYVSYKFYCAKVCLSSTVVGCSSHGTWKAINLSAKSKFAPLHIFVSCQTEASTSRHEISVFVAEQKLSIIHFFRFSSGSTQFRQNLPSTCRFWSSMIHWLVVSTHLKNISQNENLPQVGMKIKNIWVATT